MVMPPENFQVERRKKEERVVFLSLKKGCDFQLSELLLSVESDVILKRVWFCLRNESDVRF